MNKQQLFASLSALILFAVLYFGFSTKPDKQKVLEKSRALQSEALDFNRLEQESLAKLTETQSAEIRSLKAEAENAKTEQSRSAILKKISGVWYQAKNLTLAAGIAEQVAALENADSSWSVAGASFYEALITEKEETIRQYCVQHAVAAFESAISLNSSKVEHRVNLALVYAEYPPKDNPMKAVLMLRELESQHPENAAVYNALGRLAIKTGQWERAIARLEKSWSLDKKNPNTPCLLAKAYQGAGNQGKFEEYSALCR